MTVYTPSARTDGNGTVICQIHYYPLIYPNPKYWKFLMYDCVEDETGKYGWGRALDYLGIEWENEPGQIKGQMNIYDYL